MEHMYFFKSIVSPSFLYCYGGTLVTLCSGPNNGVDLNKCVGWIFCLPFISEDASLWKNFKLYYR